MKKMIRLFALLISVLCFSFVACEKPNEEAPNPNEEQPPKQEETLNPPSSDDEDDFDYGLGDFENENTDNWWDGNFETPETPEEPETPENPETPETPDEPTTPETPEEPEEPENPEDGDFDFETKPY